MFRRLVQQSEAMGYSFWHPDAKAGAKSFRSADTVEVTHPRLAAAIWCVRRLSATSRLGRC
jgi:hypothetical protein